MTKQQFKEFIRKQPNDLEIINKEGNTLSWNNCAIGRFIREVLKFDPDKHSHQFNSCKNELLVILPNIVSIKLSSGVYKTYGELQEDL